METKSIFDDKLKFKRNESRSYMYQLVENMPPPPKTQLGRLIVTWYNSTGDLGQIGYLPSDYSFGNDHAINVDIIEKPKFFVLEQPTPVKCKITNRSRDILLENVRVVLQEQESLILTALSDTGLGVIPPGDSREFSLCIFPGLAGLQRLVGLQIFASDKPWNHNYCEIYVKY